MLPQSDSTFSHKLCTNIVSLKYLYSCKNVSTPVMLTLRM